MPIKSAIQVSPQSLDWLWLFRIAVSTLLLLDGDPDLG
jgi:hypothetical protein